MDYCWAELGIQDGRNNGTDLVTWFVDITNDHIIPLFRVVVIVLF